MWTQGTLFGDAEESTPSSVDFLASRTPVPANVKLKRTNATCGQSTHVLSEASVRLSLSLRTFLESELQPLTTYSLTWKRKATPAGREWWVLGRSAPRTEETGCGLWGSDIIEETSNWQTPTVAAMTKNSDYQYSRGDHSKPILNLAGQVKSDWPTPTAMNPNEQEPLESWLARREQLKKTANNGNGCGMPLGIAVRMDWPTPMTMDYKSGNASDATTNKNSRPLNEAVLLDNDGLHALANVSTTGNVNEPSPLARRVIKFSPAICKSIQRAYRRGKLKNLPILAGVLTLVLRAEWVLQLMGAPSDWCDLPTETLLKLRATPSSHRSSPPSAAASEG